MCENPLVILSQHSMLHLFNDAQIYFYDNLEDSSTLSTCGSVKDFLHDYHSLDAESINEVVKHSYFICNGHKFPIFTALPCSKCQYCRYDFRREIENRAIIEAANCGTIIFYTLTYADASLPEFGLRKSDVQSAFKRLRQYINRYVSPDITFTNMYVGEYGGNPNHSLRPHYHGVLFFNRFLTKNELFTIEDMFKPSRSTFEQNFPKNQQNSHKLLFECISRGLCNKDLHITSKFYNDHPRLQGFWPHGLLYDFQQPKKGPVALVRYLTKYITKFTINEDDIAIFKEKDNKHFEPMFFQLPKSVGLGCKYIDKYRDAILNSVSGTITIRTQSHSSSVSFNRIKIPNIFIRKLFPTIGQLCPRVVFNVHLVDSLIHELSAKFFYDEQQQINLQSAIVRFEPYAPLLNISLKRKEKVKLDTYTAFIVNNYHNTDYQTPVDDCNQRLEECNKIFSILESYLNELSPDVTFENYKHLTLTKLNYYQNLQIPERSCRDVTAHRNQQISSDDYYTKSHMIYSPFNQFA